MEDSTERRGRGKPRDEQLRQKILQAAAELLFERGYRGFTIEGVAARAMASKVTIYKWLTSKGALALDAYIHNMTESISFPQTDSPRDDVENQLVALIEQLTTTPAGRAIGELIGAAQGDPQLKHDLNVRFIQPRRELAAQSFARLLGWDPIEKRDDLWVITDQVYGAIYHRLLCGIQPLDRTFARQLIELWAGKIPT